MKCFIKFKSRNNILSYHYHSRPLHSVLICIILYAYFLLHIINIGILANKLTFLPFSRTNRHSGGTKVHFSLFVLSLCKLHAMQFFTWLIPIARCEKQLLFLFLRTVSSVLVLPLVHLLSCKSVTVFIISIALIHVIRLICSIFFPFNLAAVFLSYLISSSPMYSSMQSMLFSSLH